MRSTPFSVRFLRLCLGMALSAASAFAQSGAPVSEIAHPPASPRDRVRGPVTAERTPLKGQTRRLNPAAVDLGQVSASLSTGRMVLWLRRSPEQQAQLGQYLSQVQNPKSANYRHWMSPASYGTAYGISDHDLAAVEQWLQASGLKVEKVSAAHNAILFSGTAGTLSSAFHTSIHSYKIGEQQHFANATDPEIPAALAPVIAGVSPMNDFRAKPLHVLGTAARYDAGTHRMQPAMTGGNSTDGYSLYVTPADASIIYDTPNQNYNPAATQTLDGTGVTIGILGYSALAMADVQNYRTAFLPAGAASNLPQQILDGGVDPGVMNGGDAGEALLDVEVAGGLAPGATIDYYYAASTDLSDGLILAGLRALEDNKINVLSVSYGSCEADLGVGGNLAWSELWQQAAAQGITVTVSTGDSGSAGCDGDTANKPIEASRGLSINGIASTPYNVAVGGTDFYSLIGNFSTYVNTSNPGPYPYPYYATALSYIPENAWNDSAYGVAPSFTLNTPTQDRSGATNIIGGGGGLSSAAVCMGSINADGSCSQSMSGYQQPPYQTAFQAANPVRSIPDVSLLAANGFYGASWVFCSDSTVDQQGGLYTDCQTDANGQLVADAQIGLIGGTSAAAPAFAGMLAMISQSQSGARLGQADTVLYNLALDYPGKYQQAFHDVTAGNNSVYCATGSQDCDSTNFLEGYNATPSYDMATGLGSVDLSHLINVWTATNFTSTSNALTAGTSTDAMSSAPISVSHGTPLNFSAAVTPADATGLFSIVTTSSSNPASYSDFGSLDPTATGSLTTNDLPGGTYTVYAYYAGDTNHTASQSSNGISVTITPESSTTTLSYGTYDPITFALSEGVSTVAYGSGSYISAQPFGNNSTVDYTGNLIADGIPTGSVTFTADGLPPQSAGINSVGIAQLNITSLAPGTYNFKASYPGDASFNASASPLQTLTVTKGATTLQLQANAAAVTPTGQVRLSALLQTDSIAQYPTGTVFAQANGHSYAPSFSQAGQSKGVDANAFQFIIPASDLAQGSNLITVTYGGDNNYQAANASVSVTLVSPTGSYTLSGPDQPLVVEASQQASTTISITSNGFTGQINMTCSVSTASSGHAPTCQSPAATVYGSFGASTVLTVATYGDTPAGDYTITLTGISGQQSQSVQIPLKVTDGPGFALSASDSALSLSSPGQSTTATLSIAPIQGFTGTVALNCIVAPTPSTGKAPTCTLPGSVPLGTDTANVTMQIGSDSTTVPGSYTVAITAVSGVVQGTIAVPLVVQQLPASPTFGLSASSNTVTVGAAGQSVTDTLTLRPAGGFTGTVQLSCSVSGGSSSSATPTCVVPASASITGSSVVNATLTVNTIPSKAAVAAKDGRLFGEGIGGIALGCLLIFMAPRRRFWTAFGVLVLAFGSMAFTACGGGGHSSTGTGTIPGTPAGSYTVTVSAVSGAINATTQVNVTVQ